MATDRRTDTQTDTQTDIVVYKKWVVQNLDKEASALFKTLYETLYTSLDAKSVPQAILIIAGYQYKSAFVADQEINMVACLTEIMAGCKFK